MTTISNKYKAGSKSLRGINYTSSGSNQVVIVQKNGVIRAQTLKRKKAGSTKA